MADKRDATVAAMRRGAIKREPSPGSVTGGVIVRESAMDCFMFEVLPGESRKGVRVLDLASSTLQEKLFTTGLAAVNRYSKS
jgi:hypothetical protein